MQKQNTALDCYSIGEVDILSEDIQKLDSTQLLHLYKETGDESYKWELVIRNSDYVKRIATQTCGMYSKFTQLEDIVHEGIIVLLNAVDRFDVTKDVKFETYVSKRLRGMIIDIARKQDWVPRQLRQKSIKINKAVEDLSNKLGYKPSNDEIATHLGVTRSEYDEMVSETAVTGLMSLEAIMETYNNTTYKMTAISGDDDAPEKVFEEKELKRILKNGVETLRENEQMVLSLYYEKELTMKEIAHVMGISPPRVSQLHSRAVERLRTYMQELIV